MVFGVCRAIDLVVPDIPETLDIKIKRERYLAKQALADAEQLLQQVLFLYHILIKPKKSKTTKLVFLPLANY